MRGAWFLALSLLGALGLGLWGLREAFALRPLALGPCRPGPLPERAELWTNGVVEIPLCRKATLVLRLECTPAQGKGPHVLVAEGGRLLFEGEVLGLVELRFRTSGEGIVAVAFTDDLYLPPEDRNLFLRGLLVEP